eukprot:1335385-Prymnesium_polylepis.1
MMRRVAVSGATRTPRCRGWHEVRLYVSMRGLIGSRRVPPTCSTGALLHTRWQRGSPSATARASSARAPPPAGA